MCVGIFFRVSINTDPMLSFSKWLFVNEKFVFSQWFEIPPLANIKFPKHWVFFWTSYFVALIEPLFMFLYHKVENRNIMLHLMPPMAIPLIVLLYRMLPDMLAHLDFYMNFRINLSSFRKQKQCTDIGRESH